MAARVSPVIFKLLVFTGILLLCVALNTRMQNIALNKACDISSRHVNEQNLTSGNCSAAINGNTNTVLNMSATPPNCIHTGINDTSPFWWVDLGQRVAINTITIYGRTDFKERMICVNVSLDGKVVKRFDDTNGWSNYQYNITVERSGRLVNITKDCNRSEVVINICEVEVWVCDDGWYGDNCTQVCGHCAGGSVCDKINGSCTSCDTGFQLPMCTECADGWYGVNCTQTCGNCSNNSACDKVNGSCGSCKPGYRPPLCQECLNGWYGSACSQTCGNCFNNSVCDKTSGSCLSCKTGFNPPFCKECQPGWYGINCNETCGYCLGGNTTCDKMSGNCRFCDGAFKPPLCKDRCDDGYYGESCSHTCGHCRNNTTCDPDNGTCLSGCVEGFKEGLCSEPMTSSRPNVSSTPVGAIVGTVLTVIVAAVVVTIVVMWLRRRRQTWGWQGGLLRGKAQNPENEYAVSDNMTNISTNRDLTDGTRALSLGGKNRRKDKAPVTTRKSLVMTERTENRRIYENVSLKAINPLYTDDIQSNMNPTNRDKEKIEYANTEDEEDGVYNIMEDIYASYRSLGPSSIFDDLQNSLLATLASGKLGMEFEEFRKDMHYPHKAGLIPENVTKNRFKALCPYDHSRVVLRRPKGDSNTDYINASYIKGCLGKKSYIATQGPRSHTVDDLWWMVWQENVTQIIMLTNLKESGKVKCEEYWPSVGTTKTYGHVTITGLKTDTHADFVIRHFVLKLKQGGGQRTVSQYHYLVWPDHGVPSTCSLVSFWRYVKARAQSALPVVHCSAGVGRTGTYIALDIASDLSSRGHDVNVKDIVRRLREDRTLMVQTAEQYRFLHEVILEEYTSRGTRMTFDQFDLVFTDNIDDNNSRIDKEFKVLKQMGHFVPKPNHTVAESKENVAKNRNTETLPDDSHLVYLMDHVPGRNQFINAVYISSSRKRQGLILTQLPLPDTVVDMWRLIDGWDVNTIVSLGHEDQSQSVKNNCRYWPETAEDTLTTGKHTISLTSSSTLGPHLTCYNLSLATKVSDPKEIRVLYYNDWKDLVPGSISELRHLIDILESWHVKEDTSPLVVQCSDGMARSGMFCALYDIISRARHDQEIDVYLSVRHVQRVRPQAVTTEMEYRFCYQAVQEYKLQSVYQN